MSTGTSMVFVALVPQTVEHDGVPLDVCLGAYVSLAFARHKAYWYVKDRCHAQDFAWELMPESGGDTYHLRRVGGDESIAYATVERVMLERRELGGDRRR